MPSSVKPGFNPRIDPGASFALAGTRAYACRSAACQTDYQILLAEPEGPLPPHGYPALCLLDGTASFCTLVESLRRAGHRPAATGIGPALVVGIGHPGSALDGQERREKDFTFAAAEVQTGDTLRPHGGGPAFLHFLLAELRPAIEQAFPVNRWALFGHSLGGLFALDVFLRHPDSFATYLAISPSIWRNQASLHRAAEFLPERLSACPHPPQLFIGVGEYEQKTPPWADRSPEAEAHRHRRHDRGMVDRARALATRLADQCPPGQVLFEEFAQEDHASILPVAFGRGLRLAT